MKNFLVKMGTGALIMLAFACKKDNNNNTPTYTVPTTYNFTNVNDSNQAKLLLMADQIGAAVNVGNSLGVSVNAQKLKDMFNNVNGYFTDSSYKLNNSGLKLADYCPSGMKTDMLRYFDSIALYSQSSVAASAGVAGVVPSSVSSSKKYLLSPTGIFYSQVFKKTIMAMCAYQIANVYLKDSISNSVDNSTVVTGYGTAMEHHWDEAFGFFYVPVNFPSTTTGLKYLSSYSNQVNPGMNSNARFMTAFLKGRAAISNKDMTGKQKQADSIARLLDIFNAACVVQEMKETDANLDAGDAVAAYGTLSESLGFVRGFQYNTSSTRIITNTQINQLLALFDSTNPNNPNLYAFVNAGVSTTAQIKLKTNAIRQLIGSIYGFSASDLTNL